MMSAIMERGVRYVRPTGGTGIGTHVRVPSGAKALLGELSG